MSIPRAASARRSEDPATVPQHYTHCDAHRTITNPAQDVHGEFEPTPGIREQPRPAAAVRSPARRLRTTLPLNLPLSVQIQRSDEYPPFQELVENPPRPYGSDRLADRLHTAMASFGHASARQADVGEVESVDRTRRIGRRETELSPRHGSRRKKINLAKSSSGGLPPLDGLCAFAKT